MSTSDSDADGSIGQDPEDINDAMASDEAVADALGFDLDAASAAAEQATSTTDATHQDDSGDDLPSREEMWAVIQHQQARIDELSDLKETVNVQRQTIKHQGEVITDLEERVKALEADAEKAESTRKHLTKSVSELSERVEASGTDATTDAGDQQDGTAGTDETATQAGPTPASSSLDFFLNNDQYYVNQAVSSNRARAVETVRRWQEFATVGRSDNIWFRREDVKEALTAIMGKKPHRQTIARVYEKIDEMGGQDVRETSFGAWKANGGEKALKATPETMDRFEEGRYVGMGLLSGNGSTGSTPDALTTVVTASG